MAKYFAICRIDGVLDLATEHPGDGYYALAEGEHDIVSQQLKRTAQVCYSAAGNPQLRVPGTTPIATDRENLEAVALYIQVLDSLTVPGFRALGV